MIVPTALRAVTSLPNTNTESQINTALFTVLDTLKQKTSHKLSLPMLCISFMIVVRNWPYTKTTSLIISSSIPDKYKVLMGKNFLSPLYLRKNGPTFTHSCTMPFLNKKGHFQPPSTPLLN